MADEWLDDIPVFRPRGEMGLAQAASAVADALARVRDRGGRELMVVATALAGLPVPDVSARHRMMRLWAEAGGGRVRLVVVAAPHLIDAEKFGVVAARNFGLHGEVFTDEGEAADWLRLHR